MLAARSRKDDSNVCDAGATHHSKNYCDSGQLGPWRAQHSGEKKHCAEVNNGGSAKRVDLRRCRAPPDVGDECHHHELQTRKRARR